MTASIVTPIAAIRTARLPGSLITAAINPSNASATSFPFREARQYLQPRTTISATSAAANAPAVQPTG